MACPGSLHEMELSQVSEPHESKDSQAFLDALKAEFGWGKLQSGECIIPGGDGAGDYACTNHYRYGQQQQVGHVGGSPSASGASDQKLDAFASVRRPAAGRDTRTRILQDVRGLSALSCDSRGGMQVIEASDDVVLGLSSLSQSAAASFSHNKKMETSQLSPTQVNTDRDYRALCGNVESSELGDGSPPEAEPRNLQDDGSGAVDFGDLEVRSSSQISEDVGFDNTKSLWRSYRASQHAANGEFTPHKLDDLLPETPALPRNPFGADPDISNIPFAGTQLFRQTQLLTSAAKQTPASSRPSPRLLYDMTSPNTDVSPANDGMGASSPADAALLPGQPSTQHGAMRMRSRRLSPDDAVLESPSVKPTKSSKARQPLAHYEPMKQSQQRKAIDETPSMAEKAAFDSDSDDDGFLVRERRKRLVGKKKAQAARELDKVNFVRAGSHRDSDDSPGRKRRRLNGAQDRGGRRGDRAAGAQGHREEKVHDPLSEAPKGQASAPEVEESPKTTRRVQSTGQVSPDENIRERSARVNKVTQRIVDEDVIPATSPAQAPSKIVRQDFLLTSEAELPPPEPGLLDVLPESNCQALPSSSDLPLAGGRRSKSYGAQAQMQRRLDEAALPEISMDGSSASPASSLDVNAAGQAGLSLSTMSTLTPVDSSVSTRDTSASPGSDSPTTGKSRRPRTLRSSARIQSPMVAITGSTDELQKSPVSTAGPLTTTSRSARASCQPVRQTFSGVEQRYPQSLKLFDGMAFAISMQPDQSGMQRTALEKKITQAGGLILEDGFEALFETSTVANGRGQTIQESDALRLAQAGADCGFTALIADGHSRKPKYMQALALGLPCLAQQWVSACLAKDQMVDWQPYLLASGVSAALGDTVLSRCLQPYPAAGARLADRIEQRSRLLAGQSLLLLAANPKGARSWNKEYIFLAQALGPRVCRVWTGKDALEALGTREEAGDAFDWIYIDEAIHTADLLLLMGERTVVGKKRKKSAMIPPRIGNTRVLSNELVIQSLISGRMIGEDELPP